MTAGNPFEFYPTPAPATEWLFTELQIRGRCADVTVGARDIITAADHYDPLNARTWVTNDLDPRWPADFHLDAKHPELYRELGDVDWHIGNPPFTPAVDIIRHARKYARVGVAMHLRISIHEPTKTGIRRSWLHDDPPTGILFLPRFAHQRSPKTGKWSTDSATCCWCVWTNDDRPHFIRYAPEHVIERLQRGEANYRTRMDRLMAQLQKEAA